MKSKNYSEKILKVFRKGGFVLSEPDVLLDSDYIIQRSGENFRKLMLTFKDDTGKSMCLRPDLTVASCIKYLKDKSRGTSKIFYSGQAYRRSNNPKEEVVHEQVGLEIIGSKKKASDDNEFQEGLAALVSPAQVSFSIFFVSSCPFFIWVVDFNIKTTFSFISSIGNKNHLKKSSFFIVLFTIRPRPGRVRFVNLLCTS